MSHSESQCVSHNDHSVYSHSGKSSQSVQSGHSGRPSGCQSDQSQNDWSKSKWSKSKSKWCITVVTVVKVRWLKWSKRANTYPHHHALSKTFPSPSPSLSLSLSLFLPSLNLNLKLKLSHPCGLSCCVMLAEVALCFVIVVCVYDVLVWLMVVLQLLCNCVSTTY